MARKETTLVISAEGRDKGKAFLIKEADAFTADRWANRAMLMLLRGQTDIPKEILQMGVVGLMVIAERGLGAVAWEDLSPLLDELMSCVRYIPTPNNPSIVRDINRSADDIEEISTLREIRKTIFMLHAGFIDPVAP